MVHLWDDPIAGEVTHHRARLRALTEQAYQETRQDVETARPAAPVGCGAPTVVVGGGAHDHVTYGCSLFDALGAACVPFAYRSPSLIQAAAVI